MNSIRHEVLFIERAKEKIAVGGHNVIIVPRMILGDTHSLGAGQEARIARHLLGWYEDVLVYRFPDGEYERFKQVVILACKRRSKYAMPTKEATDAIVSLADETAKIQVLPEGDGRYVIPAASGQIVFKFTTREPKDEVRAMRKCNPTATPEYKRATHIRPVGEAFNPVESIKVGHVTLLISGNSVGAVKLKDEAGQPMMVKGTSHKVIETSVVTNIDDKGNEHDDVTTVDKYVPVWTVTHADGQIETLTKIEAIAKLAEKYAHEMADAVQVRNTPLYGNNPTPAEWTATARIGVNMPTLPGRKELGLFERQRHWAIALQRTMRSRRHAIANLGMGSGKTVITIGALTALNEFPAVVVVPAHMPAEWIKTAILGSDPESPIKPMWITRPTREAQAVSVPAIKEIPGASLDFSKLLSPLFHPQYQPGWITEWNTNTTKWASLQKAITDIAGEVVQTMRWHDEKDDNVRRWRKVEVNCAMTQASQIAGLVSRSLVVRMDGFTYKPEISFLASGVSFTYFDTDDYTLFDFEQDWRSGKLGAMALAIISIETAKYDAGELEGQTLPRKSFISTNEETGELLATRSTYCPHCGQPARVGWRFCKNRLRKQKLGDPILNESGKIVSFNLQELPANDRDLPVCGMPLFQFSRYRRTGGARLLQHKLRGLFKVYVADECFPGNTPISTPHGDMPIKEICIGDSVFTEQHGQIALRKVTRVIRNRRQSDLLKITHSKGELICTPNHKIYLNGKFVKAEDLKSGDELTLIEDTHDYQAMCNMRKAFPNSQLTKTNLPKHLRATTRSSNPRRCRDLPNLWKGIHPNQNQKRKAENLQPRLRFKTPISYGGEGTKGTTASKTPSSFHELRSVWKAVREHRSHQDPAVLLSCLFKHKPQGNKQRLETRPGMARQSIQAHDAIQSDDRPCSSRESHHKNARKNVCGYPRRKWATYPSAIRPCKRSGLGDGSFYSIRKPKMGRIGCRYWQSGTEDCRRSRWWISSHNQTEEQRSNEGRNANGSWLESDQVLELTDRKRLGKVCVVCVEPVRSEEEYVYNLEVEDTHRYFADHILVSNCHKMKSLDTDAGAADQRLISATKYSLGLTGTLFGGNASSVFPILYRRVPDVRAQFAFDDITRWVDTYGIWEKKWKENKASLTGRGASTGIARWAYRSRELPGVSPATIGYLLPICVFGQVTDLGYELPPFADEVESISMTPAMRSQYESGKANILTDAMELLREDHDPGGLSVWFNFCRFRPNSMFRPEEFAYSGKFGGGFGYSFSALNAAGEFLPKEQRLAALVAENARQGRKTLIFAEQTGTRDIRSRLKHAIESGGASRPLNVEILSAGDMAPAKRMAWIKANAPNIDALIVNPKLVETGLTLTMFSSIIFYETAPSLYTVWQSMRRVWRLGQSRSVNTYFVAYNGTVEEDILCRMGRKMRYASMLYGDSAASVLETSDADESIQDEIIRAALSGVLSEKEAIEHLFSTGNEKIVSVSTEITGSLVARTPNLPTAPSWDEWRKIKGAVESNTRRKTKDAALSSQLSIGFI